MAQVTTQIVHIEGVLDAYIVYDDAKAFPEDEGLNIDNCDLIEVRVDVFAPVAILFRRGNGSQWHSRSLVESAVFSAGGPVKQVSDIPYTMFRVL